MCCLSKTLLLLSERADDKAFADEICKLSELKIQVVRRAPEAIKLMQEASPQVILVDASTQDLYSTFEGAVSNSLGLFSEKVHPNSIHFLLDSTMSEASFIVQSPLLGSFVKRSSSDPAGAGNHYGRIIRAGLKAKSFGLKDIYLEEAKVQRIEMSQISQKSKVLEAVKAYLLAAKWSMRPTSRILTSVDELLMNAFYDAPQASFASSSNATTPALDLKDLEQKGSVLIDLAFDGKYFGIAVTDFYGSLDKAKLMNYISKGFSKSEYKVKTTTFNAGIGLSTVHQTGGSLLFLCEASVKTEAILFFQKSDKFKDFRNQFRFISTQFYF